MCRTKEREEAEGGWDLLPTWELRERRGGCAWGRPLTVGTRDRKGAAEARRKAQKLVCGRQDRARQAQRDVEAPVRPSLRHTTADTGGGRVLEQGAWGTGLGIRWLLTVQTAWGSRRAEQEAKKYSATMEAKQPCSGGVRGGATMAASALHRSLTH